MEIVLFGNCSFWTSIKVPGDLLLIGDVNPGGTVMAGGNIFIMGSLKGIAHAGCYGNDKRSLLLQV